MTDMPEFTLTLAETAHLQVLDPVIGPADRAVADLALGDEVLAVAGGRMCFRRIMAIEDAPAPQHIVGIPAGSIAPGSPSLDLSLDAGQPVAAANAAAPLLRTTASHLLSNDDAHSIWVCLRVDGAERILVDNLAVGVALLPPLPAEPVVQDFAAPVSLAPLSIALTEDASSGRASLLDSVEPPVRAWSGPAELPLVAFEADGPHGILRFALPPRTTIVKLISPSIQPAGDSRRLGVAMFRLQVDGVDVELDSPALTRGFHRAESSESLTWRWTDGDSIIILPAKSAMRSLSIHITDWHTILKPG